MTDVFENTVATPTLVDSNFSLPNSVGFVPGAWEAFRDGHTPPRVVSSFEGCEAGRAEFLEGARLLRLTRPKKSLHPQQLVVADALNAVRPDGRPLNAFMGILVPRRSAKTTSVLAVALGRCALRDDYLVGFTLATTRDKAAARFKLDIVKHLELLYPDKSTRPFLIRTANGSEMITWPNGSMFAVVTPSAEAFRSEAYDMVIIDESGEASPELSEELLTGALATTDTRPDAQFVILGTAPEYRTGNLLWDTLEDGRAGVHGTGIVEYSTAEPVSVDDLKDWDTARDLVIAAHPGIGTLTTLEVIEERHRRLKPESFAREYLSIAGNVGDSPGILDMEKWANAGQSGHFPSLPEKFALAIATHPDQLTACIVAVWRRRGRAQLLMMEQRPGTSWLRSVAPEISAKYKTPIVHDNRGPVMVEVEAMQKLRPRPQFLPQTTRDVTTAAAKLVQELDDENVDHWNQDEMTLAAKQTKKRRIVGSWGFGRGVDADDISLIEAASLGLRAYDNKKTRQPLPQMTLAG